MQEVLEPLTGKALFFIVASRASPHKSSHGCEVFVARKAPFASTKERKGEGGD
jgi:hypothetical protein